EQWDKEPVKLEAIDEDAAGKLARNDTKKLLVVNVWATWCAPCVAELPDFVTMNRMYRKRPFQLVTICLDDPEKKEEVLKALRANHVACTNRLQGTRQIRRPARQAVGGPSAPYSRDCTRGESAVSQDRRH